MSDVIISIYKKLWNLEVEFAQKIAGDSSILPSLRAMADYILYNYEKTRQAYLMHNNSENEIDNMLWQEVYILLLEQGFVNSGDGEKIKQIAHNIVSTYNWTVVSRLYIANIHEAGGFYSEALDNYQAVLVSSPLNFVALVGSVRNYLYKKDHLRARLALKDINKHRVVSRLRDSVKVKWRIVLSLYWLESVRVQAGILVAALAYFAGFFLPEIWYIPTAIAVGCVALFVFFLLWKKIKAFILLRFASIIFVVWLIAYGTRSFFMNVL
ncbi:MAG: hypothetical protein QY332_07290 [Anaerolineales bacterium]|nr:MAG: hypothetical protein QY332_07290 [Anaerolineales bacterium]